MSTTERLWGGVRVGCLLLFGTMAACGEAEKVPDPTKAISMGAATKSGPSLAQRAGEAVTSMVSGEADKGTAPITPGQTTAGTLSGEDGTFDNGAFFDAWVFDVTQRSDVSVTLTSGVFDTYLTLLAGEPGTIGDVVAANDDADGTNSGLSAGLDPGTYTAVATSYAAGSTGAYEITVRTGASDGGDSRVLEPGRTASGSLNASDDALEGLGFYNLWSLSGRGGDQVTVTLESTEFDAYVGVMSGTDVIGENDDFGGTTNSQVTVTLPTSGTYAVLVTSYASGQTGAYTLSASSTPRAPFAGFSTGGDPNGRYALLVGIDDYPGSDNDLRGPIEDARIVQRVLVERFGFDPANVVTLNDSDATRANIAQGVAQHLGQAGPNGVAVLFYSGHGTQLGENIGITGSLDPEPLGKGDQAIYVYGSDYGSSVLLDEEIGYLIETIDAGRTLVVVDACFSGEITRGPGNAPQSKSVDLADPTVASMTHLPNGFITSELKALNLTDMSLGFGDFGAIEQSFQNPARHVMWGASTDDQVSWTSGLGNGASVFTYYFGERMMAAPGSSTFGSVHQAVHDDVVAYITNQGNMTMQNPQMRGSNQSMSLDAFFRQR